MQTFQLAEYIIDTFKTSEIEMHLGGVSMIADDTISFVKNDILVFGLGAIIFILIVLYLIFFMNGEMWIIFSVQCLWGWKIAIGSDNLIFLIIFLLLLI